MIGVVQYEGGEHEYAAVVGFNRREAHNPSRSRFEAPVARVGSIDQSVLDAVVEHRLPPGAKRPRINSAQSLEQAARLCAAPCRRWLMITSAHWRVIAEALGEGLGAKADIVHVPTDTLVRYHPEWEGPLMGDKTWPALFDHAKVKRVAGDFAGAKELKDVLAEPIAHFKLRLRSEGPQTGELER
jgi:hypothetical protein